MAKTRASDRRRTADPGVQVATAVPGRGVRLRDVLESLGPTFLQVVVAPGHLDVPVELVTIYDPMDEIPIEAGAILLGVGIAPDSADADTLVVKAASAGAAAVAFKFRGRTFQWTERLGGSGLAIIQVADEMSWGQLSVMLSLAIPLRSATIPEVAGVPLGDLFSLANAIAGVIGGAVLIEDQRTRVVAYSTLEGQVIDEARRQSILGRQVPTLPGNRALYQRLWAAEGVIRVDDVEGLDLPRLGVAIRAGAEQLGSLWVVEGNRRFGEFEERALAEAGRVAALHIIHARASLDIERRMRGDLLKSLLDGRADPESIASRLGIPVHSPVAVVAIQLVESEAVQELHRERLIDLVAMYCEAFRLRSAWVDIGNTVYGLIPVDSPTSSLRLKRRVRDMHDHAQSALNVPLRTAISSVTDELRRVPAAVREVERILRVMQSKSDGTDVASIDDVRAPVGLMIIRDLLSSDVEMAPSRVPEIASYDADHGTLYLKTLRAYLSAFGDSSRAAESLGVHPNTFRYRLRRLVEVFNIDLNDPDERLLVDLELRLSPRQEAPSTASFPK